MNVRVKRLMASWVLLAVYVPILVVASLHVHPSETLAQNTCDECVHHNCGGHMGQQTAFVHACVLCQFLTLSYLTLSVVAVLASQQLVTIIRVSSVRLLSYEGSGHKSTRAPPYAF